MKRLILALSTIFLVITSARSQEVEIAHLKEDGTIEVEKIALAEGMLTTRSTFSQLPGFPFKAKVHPNFKNFRNVSIIDLDGDELEEVLVCLDETLYVINHDGSIKWQYTLEGTSNFPPAIADIDGDGDLEIALQTYELPARGNVYLFDHEGTIQDGWPLRSPDRIFLNAVTLADLNEDGQLEVIACERISASSGRVHALKKDGNPLDGNWPISIPGTPAFTPSVADFNYDGVNELITSTTTGLYAFNASGSLLAGFPVIEQGAKFSYQSPLLADLNNDENLEIITARHNQVPGTVVVASDGSYYEKWPDYDNIWTFATPSVADIDNDEDYEVFYSRPHSSDALSDAILLGYDHEGNLLDGFPIEGIAGAEGVIAIADIDNDGDYELITSSKAAVNGMGLIQAYHVENQEVVENFPIQVEGFTFLNGAFLSDVDNDGMLDLSALSYQLKFDAASPDSAYVNVFNLEVPIDERTILFNGYKGSLSHDGLVDQTLTSNKEGVSSESLLISPNPVENMITISHDFQGEVTTYQVFSTGGQVVKAGLLANGTINVSSLTSGAYALILQAGQVQIAEKFMKL